MPGFLKKRKSFNLIALVFREEMRAETSLLVTTWCLRLQRRQNSKYRIKSVVNKTGNQARLVEPLEETRHPTRLCDMALAQEQSNVELSRNRRYIVIRSGVVANLKLGTLESPLPLSFPPFSSPILPSPSPSLPSLPSFLPYLPLEVCPVNPARGSWERCKLPQRGLGRNPSRNRI